MRIRTQKSNIITPPKYEKDITSTLIYNDKDEVIFAVTETPAGTYKFTHIGQPDFVKEVKQITGMVLSNPDIHIVKSKNG